MYPGALLAGRRKLSYLLRGAPQGHLLRGTFPAVYCWECAANLMKVTFHTEIPRGSKSHFVRYTLKGHLVCCGELQLLALLKRKSFLSLLLAYGPISNANS